MAFQNTNLGLFAYSTNFILKRAKTLARLLSQSSGYSFTPGNGYRYDIFINPGSFTVHTSGYMDVMLVGGGGGGGSGGPGTGSWGGGGGAGGVKTIYNQLFNQGNYTVTIGGGGNGGGYSTPFSPPSRGENGQDSSISGPSIFSTITALGGGGGGVGVSPPVSPLTTPNPTLDGADGGSGGGAGGAQTYGYSGDGTPGEGYPGGLGESTGGSSPFAGGGGGGASESGGSYPSTKGGFGISAFSDDTGIPSDYGTPGPGSGRYFGGGGYGGASPTEASTIAPVGGGGKSTYGLSNTGGGGAGGREGGYSGGTGIVIIRSLVSF